MDKDRVQILLASSRQTLCIYLPRKRQRIQKLCSEVSSAIHKISENATSLNIQIPEHTIEFKNCSVYNGINRICRIQRINKTKTNEDSQCEKLSYIQKRAKNRERQIERGKRERSKTFKKLRIEPNKPKQVSSLRHMASYT